MFKILLIINAIAFIAGQVARIKISDGVAITLLDLSVLVTVATWVIFTLYKKNKVTGKLKLGIIAFVISCVISLTANSWNYSIPQLGIASLYLCRFVAYTCMYFIVKYQSKKKKELILSTMFITGTVVLFLGFLQYAFYPDLRGWYYLGWDEHLYRMFGTFLDPNYFGSFLVIFFLFSFQLKGEVLKRSNWKIILLLLCIILGVLLTYSRSAVVMSIVGIVTYFFLKKEYLKMLGVGVLFLLSVLLVANYRIEGLNPFRIASTTARIESANNAFQIIKDHPIFGVGFNTYRYAQNEYGFRDSSFWMTSHADAGTDNSILFILATTGILGLTTYVFLIKRIGSLRNSLDKNQKVFFLTICITLLVGSMFNNLLFYTPFMVWIWVYLGVMENK